MIIKTEITFWKIKIGNHISVLKYKGSQYKHLRKSLESIDQEGLGRLGETYPEHLNL